MLAHRLSRVVSTSSLALVAACRASGVAVGVDELDLGAARVRVADARTGSTVATDARAVDERQDDGRLGAALGALAASGREQLGRSARTSLTLGVALQHRDREDDDPVDDDVAWSLWYARDLGAGALRIAIELGAGYSEHEVDGFEAPSIEIYRACAGLKATLEPGGELPLALWARGGGFYRFSFDPDFDDEPLDQDGGGYYVGFGLDALLENGLRVGPFVDVYRGTTQDELRETSIGLALGMGF